MPFHITPELLVSPVSGLVVALVFAGTMYKIFHQIFEQSLEQAKLTSERLVRTFEAEVKACEERYTHILAEFFRLKEKR